MSNISIPEEQLAIQFSQTGGPEVIELKKIPVPRLADDEILIKVEWCGINFIDTYFRSGLYPVSLPFTLGNEPAGIVVQLGAKVTGFALGDQVTTYFRGGGLQQYTCCNYLKACKIPNSVSRKEAAALCLQGLTALTLVNEAHKVQKGEYILVHAAAGGLGTLLCQILSNIGAHVIGTTSTEEKACLAKANGAEHVVLYANRDVNEVISDIKKLTPRYEGVAAVFDGVGKDTWESNFEVAKRKGTIVVVGNASGPPPSFSALKLMAKNLKLCRPGLDQYIHTPEEWQYYTSELFKLIAKGIVRPSYYKNEGYRFSESGVREAHSDIASRKTTGKLIVKLVE
ncbi:hypothetical protein CROQUDRAFT_668489 [Cronartium quercuum f. sp. fusiforme G11]|uniref:Probable quinone oxidoreductase n=1 Tax=Cronartium quercuum f. sp. fusiforme G11 TaxID=708437 RepID=A0A9P6THA6_9BASI|nr:hypothetical protein CROQUDRAFT_668489 [Cronartium quercuum f. sp. fusiforme G11]